MREPGFHLTKRIKRHIYITKLRKEGKLFHSRSGSEEPISKLTIRMQNKLAKRALRAEKRAVRKQQKEVKKEGK